MIKHFSALALLILFLSLIDRLRGCYDDVAGRQAHWVCLPSECHVSIHRRYTSEDRLPRRSFRLASTPAGDRHLWHHVVDLVGG